MATLQRVARENGKPMPLGKLVDIVTEVCFLRGLQRLTLSFSFFFIVAARCYA